MDPTPNVKQIDPLTVLLDVLDAPNVVPGPRADQAIPTMAHDAEPHSDAKPQSADSQAQTASDGAAVPPVPPVDTTFRPAVDNARNIRLPGDQPSIARRAVRGLIGFLLAVCIGVASFVWQSPYGDEARQRLASWVPSFVLALFQPGENSGQPTPPADQAVAAAAAPAQPTPEQPTPPQPAAPTQTAPEAAAPTAATLSPELDAVAAIDGARSRNGGARYPAAQGQPGTAVPGQCKARRAAQGQPGTYDSRACQVFRAEPAAETASASASADRQGDARAGVDTPATANHRTAASRNTAAGGRPGAANSASAADARALEPFFRRNFRKIRSTGRAQRIRLRLAAERLATEPVNVPLCME